MYIQYFKPLCFNLLKYGGCNIYIGCNIHVGCNRCTGLLINDITDHLPIFAICKYRDIKRSSATKYKYVRKTDDICVNAFEDNFLLVNWEIITNEEGVNVAFAYFVDTFVSLYNNCPIKETCINDNNRPVKPW